MNDGHGLSELAQCGSGVTGALAFSETRGRITAIGAERAARMHDVGALVFDKVRYEREVEMKPSRKGGNRSDRNRRRARRSRSYAAGQRSPAERKGRRRQVEFMAGGNVVRFSARR